MTGSMTPASDPLQQSYFFLNSGYQQERQPALRIDYNISDKHRLTGTYNHFFEWRDAGSHQRGGQALPRLAQLPPGQDDASDAFGRAALHLVQHDGQRGTLRNHPRRAVVLRTGRAECAKPRRPSTTPVAMRSTSIRTSASPTGTSPTRCRRAAATSTRSMTPSTGRRASTASRWAASAFLGRAWDDSQQLTTGINLGFDHDQRSGRGHCSLPAISPGLLAAS